ncbi:hypothetical protein OTK49_21495 [Vibrio coralliirubri]|uniref:hypothetical protein n=1 Tax=Vibrio coralliirubri TaxID=1516159 RepID=UPI00228368C1|nr:hypothetical protein [Vibrio coralliirubri]MCY9865097.1 hypothetical protein [Vibrio coralliirubri]
MMSFIKNWLLGSILLVMFSAPIIQLIVGVFVIGSADAELKYMIISSRIPCLLSGVAAYWFCRDKGTDIQLAVVGYILFSITVVVTYTVFLERGDSVYKHKAHQAFEYAPVDGWITVTYGEDKLRFLPTKKFEDGGFIIKTSSDSGMLAKYHACPTPEYSTSCKGLTDSRALNFDLGLVASMLGNKG